MVIRGRTISASSNGGRFSLSTPLSPATAPSPTPSPVGRRYNDNDTSPHSSEQTTNAAHPPTLNSHASGSTKRAATSNSSNNNNNNNSYSTHSSASRRLRSRHAFRRNLQKQRVQKQQQQHQQQTEPKQARQGLHESMATEQSNTNEIAVDEEEERETGGNVSPPPASRPLIPAMDHHEHHHPHSNWSRGGKVVDKKSNDELYAIAGASSSSPPCPPLAAGQEATKALPLGHVQTIHAVFGRNTSNQDHTPYGPLLDLYRDVLEVSPSVSDRDMRIAYFKRGREILGEKGLVAAAAAGGNPTEPGRAETGAAVNVLDEETQIKFQAISMAYEILSTPGWKEEFDKLQQQQQQQIEAEGMVPLTTYPRREVQSQPRPPLQQVPSVLPQRQKQAAILEVPPRSSRVAERSKKPFKPVSFEMSPAPVPAKTTAVKREPPMPSLKRSSFQSEDGSMQSWAAARSFEERQSNRSVRWKDYVEELVFDNHPNEHGISDDDDSIVDHGDEEEDNNDNNNGGDRSQSMRSSVTLPSVNGNSETSVDRDSSSDLNSNGSKWKRKRKQRQKIVIESDELESHLRRMDTEAEGQFGPGMWKNFEESSEAERHFAVDFWDNFEESLDGILSMVDSLGDPVPTRRQGSRGRSSPSLASSMASTANNSPKNKLPAVDGLGNNAVPSHSGSQSDGHSLLSATTAGTIQSQSTFVVERSQSNDVVESEGRLRVRARACDAAPSSKYEGVRRSSSFPSGHERDESATAGSNSMCRQPSAEPTKATPVKSSAPTMGGVKDPLSPYALLANVLPFQSSMEEEAHVVSPESIYATPSDETTPHVPDPSPATALDFDQSQGERPPSPSQSSSIDSKRINFRSATDLNVASHDDGESTEAVTVASTGEFTMDSVNLSELDNPFRESVSSYESQDDGKQDDGDDVAVPTTKDRQPKVSSGGGGGSLVRNVQSTEESEDIFAGLDDFQTYDMATIPLRDSGIAVKLPHSNSFGNASGCSDCLSDLSESVFATSKADKKNTNTKKSREIKKAQSTDGSDFFSAMDMLPSLQSDASVTTMESAVESTFFDYFLAYVTALLTECEVQEFRGVSFQKDFMGLFSDSEISATESRDPEPDDATYRLKPIESN